MSQLQRAEVLKVADFATDIIAQLDQDLRHVYVNPAVEKVTGRKTRDFLGKTNEDLGMPPELCRSWRDTMSRAFVTKSPVEMDFEFHSPDGIKKFHCHINPIFDEKGRVTSVISVARDMTQILSRYELATRLAEELLDPVTIIQGNIELMTHPLNEQRQKAGFPAKWKERLKKIESAIHRISNSLASLRSLPEFNRQKEDHRKFLDTH